MTHTHTGLGCHETPGVGDKMANSHRDRCADNQVSAAMTIPGNQEKTEPMPLAREDGVRKCKQKPVKGRASSSSPKKLYCFNRTLKVKCNSVEFNVPKTEANVPALAINSNPSSESLC